MNTQHSEPVAISGGDPKPGDSDSERQLDFEKELAGQPDKGIPAPANPSAA